MNSKFYVPLETAKLLKEKGYNEDCYSYYRQNGNLYHETFTMNNDWIRKDYFLAPTYHEVVDWLEGKGIRIEVRVAYHFRKKQWSWCGYVYVVEYEDYETSQLADWCSTREQALNASILKALEMI